MRVAILVVPGVQMLNVAGPMDVFAAANRILGDASAYSVQIVGLTLDPVTSQNGTRFLPDAAIDAALEDCDTLLIAGSPAIGEYETHAELIAWIAREGRHVRRLGSTCTAALLLAQAGLLDRRRVTTHWSATARLAEMFPAITVEPDRIYVKDGSVYTSAGVTAAMDLALALVEEDHGRPVALRVAKDLVLFLQRPGGQSQFSVHLASQVSEIGPIRDVHEWILGNLAEDLSVEGLADRSGMSGRNFSRLFKRETGMTPATYVEAVRVDSARRMLEESDLSLKRIASLCGFPDQGGLRRAFMRHAKVTPVQYRRHFRADDVGRLAKRQDQR